MPRVLAWDAQLDNAVGTEYILMEEASGTPLHETWESLDLDIKSDLVDELVSISKKLLSVSFARQVSKFHCTKVAILFANGPGRYGSLYFSDSSISGCEAKNSFWDAERKEIDAVRGPCQPDDDFEIRRILTSG